MESELAPWAGQPSSLGTISESPADESATLDAFDMMEAMLDGGDPPPPPPLPPPAVPPSKRGPSRRRFSVALSSGALEGLDFSTFEESAGTAPVIEEVEAEEDTEYLTVTCPAGVVPGQALYVTTPDGHEIEVVVPDDVGEGDDFEVCVRIEQPAEAAETTAAAAAAAEEEQEQEEQEEQEQEEQEHEQEQEQEQEQEEEAEAETETATETKEGAEVDADAQPGREGAEAEVDGLAGLGLKELRVRAVEGGVAVEDIDEAMESVDPKAAMVDLILVCQMIEMQAMPFQLLCALCAQLNLLRASLDHVLAVPASPSACPVCLLPYLSFN